ncbi:hypothetical protein [Pseudomonas fulva]|nr:hypothetical protein [Pseudomonas fulva]MBF8779889.1 hypothetical protein [Pseudomonas fulva]
MLPSVFERTLTTVAEVYLAPLPIAEMPTRPLSQRRLGLFSLRQLLQYYGLAMLCIASFAVAPLLCALGAGWVAGLAGCPLDEGSVHACPIMGWDAGPLLYRLGVMGWFMLLTLPSGAVLMLAATVMLLVQLVSRLRHRRVGDDARSPGPR